MARIDKKRGSRPRRKNAGKFERFTMLAAKDRHPGRSRLYKRRDR